MVTLARLPALRPVFESDAWATHEVPRLHRDVEQQCI
jgi:hypothetical protein